MATKFGRELRKIRVYRDENLTHMAQKLKISTAYLSAIENGNRPIPEDLINKIKDSYMLKEDEIKELEKSKIETSDTITLDLSNLNDKQKDLIYVLTRKLPELKSREELINFLEEEDKSDG